MTGYQEILTDPSYCGQLVAMTYPEIGNVGVNLRGRRVVAALRAKASSCSEYWAVAEQLARAPSRSATTSRAHGIPGIEGIDTRALVRHAARPRATSTPSCRRSDLDARPPRAPRAAKRRAWKGRTSSATSTCADAVRLERGPLDARGRLRRARRRAPRRAAAQVVAYDFGIKRNILRNLVASRLPRPRRARVDTRPRDVPGDASPTASSSRTGPAILPRCRRRARERARELLGKMPIFGICLGHQILGLALGGTTYKLKFGHHGGNQPVHGPDDGQGRDHQRRTTASPSTSTRSAASAELTHVNLNDQTVEGLAHKELPLFSVQYHPEVVAGPARRATTSSGASST